MLASGIAVQDGQSVRVLGQMLQDSKRQIAFAVGSLLAQHRFGGAILASYATLKCYSQAALEPALEIRAVSAALRRILVIGVDVLVLLLLQLSFKTSNSLNF